MIFTQFNVFLKFKITHRYLLILLMSICSFQVKSQEEMVQIFYHNMGDPFLVSLLEGKKSKFLQIKMYLSLTNEDLIEHVEANDPLIRNGVVQHLAKQSMSELRTSEGFQSLADEVAEIINTIMTEIISVPVVEQVYFTRFVIQ